MHIHQVRHLPYVFGGEQPTTYNVHLYLVTVYNTIFRINKYLYSILSELILKAEMFENTKGVIWSRKSKDRKYNDQKRRKRQTSTKILHRKLKIEQLEIQLKTEDEFSCFRRVSSSCSTSGTRHVTHVGNLVLNHIRLLALYEEWTGFD